MKTNKKVLASKFFGVFLFGVLLMAPARAYPAKVGPAVTDQTPQAIAGADSLNNIVPFRVGTDGSLTSLEKKNALIHDNVTVTGAGATDRTQFPTHLVSFCTIRAYPSNAGTVYVGASTVTNASGSSRGFPLAAGDALASIRVDNSNELYGAADNANDKISILCN